jgi:hypothetical protein
MPTASNALTGEELIKEATKQMKARDSYSVISKGMMRMAGLFNKAIKESVEMSYQNEFPYLFDSAKFNNSFNFQPTSYPDGIKGTAEYALQQHN